MGILRSDHSLCISIGDLSNLDVLIAGWGLPATSLKDATLESAQLSSRRPEGRENPACRVRVELREVDRESRVPLVSLAARNPQGHRGPVHHRVCGKCGA
jgi:hypothetical protein